MKTLIENTTSSLQKNAITELAWKELIEAVKPSTGHTSEIAKNNARNRIKHHPAIITTLEMSHWGFFS